jgi:LuxR family maltose regulon positive regulatory protein
MSAPILTTKLFVPSPRPNLVQRPRLITRLDAGLRLGHRLILISAPAGFGKTTLLSKWVGRLHGNSAKENQIGNGTAWLSLDEHDNEPTCFLAYLIAALQTIKPNIGQEASSALQSPRPPPVQAVLTPLINEIATIPGRMVLILDDYHLIESQAIHDALTFLLQHLPPQMHMVIATREDPRLPLARLRARGQLAELRATDLRFTSSEAAEFLNQAMGLDLSAEDVAILERRTEGWIAGLQLAAISMKGRRDISGLVRSFTGSHRYVLDYLIEEVLEQQPESIQTFLLRTAILNRLSGPLCDAVTGQDNSQATLEMLERANLFLVPLDNERHWYRYHHLFAELLQQRLRIAHPHLIDGLHAKAAIWYERNDQLSEAIHHALASHDINTATRLIEKGALEALERSEFGFIFDFVDLLPETALQSSPWLFVYHCWALLLTGQIEVAGPRLEDTAWLLDSMSDDDDMNTMQGYIAGLKAHLAGWQRDYPNAIDFSDRAIEKLPENHWIRAYCAMTKGVAFWGSGNLAGAKKAFTEASLVGKISGNKRVAVTSAVYLGHSLELEGHLGQAVELFQNSFQLAEQDGGYLPLAAYLHVELGRVLYQLNELNLAMQHLEKGVQLCQQLSDGRVEKIGHCFLVRVYLANGDFANATHSMRLAERAHPAPETSVDMRGAEYPQVRLWLKQEKLDQVRAWLDESGVTASNISHFKAKMTYTMHARALIALGREHPAGAYLKAARDLLDELLEMAEKDGWGGKVIEILALQALAFQVGGESTRALTRLERALILAEPEGFVRVFVDEGPPLARLLYEAASCGIAPDYALRLLAAFPVAQPDQTASPEPQPPRPDIVEPLSERELEVLELVAQGLTNREISSRLFLSLNTVKAHTRNIYGKLGAHNRTQAVARARALGILSPSNRLET